MKRRRRQTFSRARGRCTAHLNVSARSNLVPLLALVGAACSAPAQAPAVADVTLAAPPSASAAPIAPPTPDEPLPPLIMPTAARACDLHAKSRWIDPVKLRGTPGGDWFAEFRGGDIDLNVPVQDHATSALVEAVAGGVRIRGHANLDELTFFAARPVTLGGFVAATPFSHLRVTSASEGKLTLAIDPPHGLELLPGTTLTAVRPCEDAALDTSSFDFEDTIAAPDKRKPFTLATGHPIDLSIEAGGPPVARLTPPADLVAVEVFDRKGAASRLVWFGVTEAVFGWVATKELRPANQAVAFGTGTGRIGTVGHGLNRDEAIRCTSEVPLVAEIAGVDAMTIGAVLPGTTIHVKERGKPWSSVAVMAGGTTFRENVRLKVRDKDLDGCVRVPPKERP